MKTSLIIGTIALALNMSACQNKTTKTAEDSDMDLDSTHMMDNTAMGTTMSEATDKMMKDMHQMNMTGNVDVDFAMMMKSHHQGAVDMAKTQLSSGTDATLKQIAQKLVDTQSAEISELQSFIDSHKSPEKNYDPAKKDDGFAKHMSDNMNMMMQMPKVEAGASVDKQFVQMMIPHHQSGIHMAEGYLQHGEDQGLKSLANKTIKDSKKEIEDFKRWEESQNK